jgi:hypothetical protein
VIRRAEIDPTGVYRYSLLREWGESGRVLFVMLNPSTADGEQDDPTIRRCMGFASDAGFGGMSVVNLFAFRATDPDELVGADNPIGPDNDRVILEEAARADIVVGGWGARRAKEAKRIRAVVELLRPRRILCLGVTTDGSPRHPLYVEKIRQFEEWKQPAKV